MAITIYEVSVPVFAQKMQALAAIIEKAEAYASARKFGADLLLAQRLFPDMLPFRAQVQLVSDHAKGASARLAGLEVPRFEDNETTTAELKARLAKTIDFVRGIDQAKFDGAEDRPISLKVAGQDRSFTGRQYLLTFALPNFYFHVTTAYDILRHTGVELGKGDFMR